jgi:hypothetical protein
MTHTFKLERLDGTPADPPSFKTTVLRRALARGRGREDEIAPRARSSIESNPAEYGYTPGYYAVFFRDADGIKLELLHRPTYWNWLRQH